MQIYLLKDLKGHGKAGQIVNLNDGYAKNFVIKNKIGKLVDNAVLSDMKAKAESAAFKNQTEIAEIKAQIEQLKQTTVILHSKVGANQKLFGSITGAEISAALAEKGIHVDKRLIVIAEPIKAIGTYNVTVKYNHQLTGAVKVVVEEINAK
ncbi:MAG: 50S ribosomal protein L9 [Clostridia bacterium]|nr:50S ribosomal protein L9 [Clostridia bacterium]